MQGGRNGRMPPAADCHFPRSKWILVSSSADKAHCPMLGANYGHFAPLLSLVGSNENSVSRQSGHSLVIGLSSGDLKTKRDKRRVGWLLEFQWLLL